MQMHFLLLNCIKVEYTAIHTRSVNIWMLLLLQDEISSSASSSGYAVGMAGPNMDCSVTISEKWFYFFPVLRIVQTLFSFI